jgi:hypothetical protein
MCVLYIGFVRHCFGGVSELAIAADLVLVAKSEDDMQCDLNI